MLDELDRGDGEILIHADEQFHRLAGIAAGVDIIAVEKHITQAFFALEHGHQMWIVLHFAIGAGLGKKCRDRNIANKFFQRFMGGEIGGLAARHRKREQTTHKNGKTAE